MSNGEDAAQQGVEEGEGSAGEAKEKTEATGAEAERPPISPEELDARQEKFRTTRRQGGPDLHGRRAVAVEREPGDPVLRELVRHEVPRRRRELDVRRPVHLVSLGGRRLLLRP